MDKSHESGHRHESPHGRWVFATFTAIAACFLFTEHSAHLFGALPYLLLLACPLLHLFHHGGHGGEARDKVEGGKQ